ncbi:hypothetical protein AAVH_42777 [Aphelenchoides avenae]|nr:hypothetical protein AAVH_42777 [Aphelenchus avenae]
MLDNIAFFRHDFEPTGSRGSVVPDCPMPVGFLTFEAVVQYILLVSSVPAAAANTVVVICAYKLLRQSGDTMHVFVISTALADLVVTGEFPLAAIV